MAIDTYITISAVGAKTAGGKQTTVPARAAAAAGSLTVAYDSAVVTTKNQAIQFAIEAINGASGLR